jgi:hypothetical protein
VSATYEKAVKRENTNISVSHGLVSFVHPGTQTMVYYEIGNTIIEKGLVNVNERKFESLVVKILGFIGYLVNRTELPISDLELEIGILLPLDEINDMQSLGKWVREIVENQGFKINNRTIKVKISRLNFKPEGYGISRVYTDKNIGVLMFGHSDYSWLYFENKNLHGNKSITFPGSGMHDLVSQLEFTIIQEISAAKIIAEAGIECDREKLLKLTQSKTEDELNQLIEAIKSYLPQYWAERTLEMDSLNIRDAEIILVAGGAAQYLAPIIKKLFKEKYKVKLDWCKNLRKEFSDRFDVKVSDIATPLFLDCFGYYKFLKDSPSVKATVVSDKVTNLRAL